jgi:hypothetical protein
LPIADWNTRAQLLRSLKETGGKKYSRPFESGELAAINVLGGSWNEYAQVVLSMTIADTLLEIERLLSTMQGVAPFLSATAQPPAAADFDSRSTPQAMSGTSDRAEARHSWLMADEDALAPFQRIDDEQLEEPDDNATSSAASTDDAVIAICNDIFRVLEGAEYQRASRLAPLLRTRFSVASTEWDFGRVINILEAPTRYIHGELIAEQGSTRAESGTVLPRSWLEPYELLADDGDPAALVALLDLFFG